MITVYAAHFLGKDIFQSCSYDSVCTCSPVSDGKYMGRRVALVKNSAESINWRGGGRAYLSERERQTQTNERYHRFMLNTCHVPCTALSTLRVTHLSLISPVKDVLLWTHFTEEKTEVW